MSPAGDDRSGLVGLDGIREAASRIAGVAIRTPLLPSPELALESGAAEVRLKCEPLQRTGSFKFRGGSNFIASMDPEARGRGVITYSSGNHGQAIALGAREAGTRAVVVMPTTAPPIKRERTAEYGARVVLQGTTSLDRKARAEAIAAEEGLTIIPPFDHPAIIAGQGTVGLEIAEDFPEVDLVLVCVGGGGLLAGVAAAVRALRPQAMIVGVEPEGAPTLRRALDAGQPVVLDRIDTIADGLAPVRAGDLTFRHARELVDDVVLVEDDAIREAARFLLLRQKLVTEFSGAAPTAALRSGRIDARGKRVAVIVSGGNIDPSVLRTLL